MIISATPALAQTQIGQPLNPAGDESFQLAATAIVAPAGQDSASAQGFIAQNIAAQGSMAAMMGIDANPQRYILISQNAASLQNLEQRLLHAEVSAVMAENPHLRSLLAGQPLIIGFSGSLFMQTRLAGAYIEGTHFLLIADCIKSDAAELRLTVRQELDHAAQAAAGLLYPNTLFSREDHLFHWRFMEMLNRGSAAFHASSAANFSGNADMPAQLWRDALAANPNNRERARADFAKRVMFDFISSNLLADYDMRGAGAYSMLIREVELARMDNRPATVSARSFNRQAFSIATLRYAPWLAQLGEPQRVLADLASRIETTPLNPRVAMIYEEAEGRRRALGSAFLASNTNG